MEEGRGGEGRGGEERRGGRGNGDCSHGPTARLSSNVQISLNQSN